MTRCFRLFTLLTSALLVTTPVLAETPNLIPGLWSYTTTTTLEGPMSLKPQTSNSQECLTQKQIDQGIDMLDIPEQCTVLKVEVLRDSSDFALSCNMQGIKTQFKGNAAFYGEKMDGKMDGEMNTPLGPMLMKMNFVSKRVGDCPVS